MDKFSPRHFVFLVFATGIVALKTYPLVFIVDAGKDSWVAVIMSSIVIALFYMFSINTMKLIRENDFLTIYRIALGRKFGTIMALLFVLTCILTLIESASIEADGMHQNMMVETPNWYFIIFFIIVSLYVVRKDLVAVMIIAIIGISMIMFAGIHLGIMTMQQKEFWMLFPVMQDGITGGFVLAVLKSLGMYGFITITLPYLDAIDDTKISLKKYSLIALAIVIQMQVVSITGIFMTFSTEQAEVYYYPKLVQTHLVSYLQILEFGELYVMLQMLVGWILKYLVAFHSIIFILKFLKIKNTVIMKLTYVISGVVLIASVILTSTSIRFFDVLQYFPWIALVNFVVIPFFVFVIYRIRIKRQNAMNK